MADKKQMKLLVNRKPVQGPWGGGNHFIKSLHDNARNYDIELKHKLEPGLDGIFLIDPRYDELGISINEVVAYKQAFPKTKIFYRANECDKRKGEVNQMDPCIAAMGQISDICFFISNWIKNYHLDFNWKCPTNIVIPNGTNTAIFKDHNQKKNNKKTNIVTHHWSNNAMKGHDIYAAIDEWIKNKEGYSFTYVGRSHAPLPNSEIVSPMAGSELGKLLSSFDVYISASRWDPGPNHIIESLACGLPTYAHVDGGGASEFVGSSHVYSNEKELIELLESNSFIKNASFTPNSWDETIKVYLENIARII